MYGIEVKNLTKKFGQFTAVNRISFNVRKGEIFGFLGPNGAGKSTTIRMLCGIIRSTSGSGSVGGYSIDTQPEEIKNIIGYMSQRFTLYQDLTVKENIDAIELCEKVGMNWSGGFMAGVINEGEEDIKRTFEFVNKVSSYEHSFLPNGAARFLGFPVSETYFQMIDEGLVAYDWLDGELLIPRTKHLTDKKVERIFDKHYNRIRDEAGSRTLIFSLKQNIKKMLPIGVTKHLMAFRRRRKWKNMIIWFVQLPNKD